MGRKPLEHVLVKPAGPACNMACGYCFYRGKESLFPAGAPRVMSEEILEEMVRQLMRAPGDGVSIGWQGGEPTLLGVGFFHKAVEFMERFGANKTVGNGIQTNGLLLDRGWAAFFRKYGFLVGLSIDGPEHVHDRYRTMRGGGGTRGTVAERARMLLDEGVQVNALTVVNDYSARFPEDIYESHKALGLSYMQFIPCVDRDPRDPGKAAPYSVGGDNYGRFLCAIYDLWRADFHKGAPATSVRFFESLLFAYAGFPPAECTLGEECGRYLVIEHDGGAYACDFFVEPSWRLGNIMEEPMEEMLNSPRQNTFGKMKARLPRACLECEWKKICRGGCVRERPAGEEVHGPSHLCDAYKRFFRHADAGFRELVAEWRRKEDARARAANPATGRVGRNDPCPCGSGQKYKKCCGKN